MIICECVCVCVCVCVGGGGGGGGDLRSWDHQNPSKCSSHKKAQGVQAKSLKLNTSDGYASVKGQCVNDT